VDTSLATRRNSSSDLALREDMGEFLNRPVLPADARGACRRPDDHSSAERELFQLVQCVCRIEAK